MKKGNIIMLVGVPGSGKSTYAEKLIIQNKGNYISLSSDNFREKLFGNINEQNKNDIVFKEMKKETIKNLSNGKTVIYDATNIKRKNRISLLSEIKDYYNEATAIIFATPYEICISRNGKREREVPIHIIINMIKSFEVPMIQEGFNHIEIIYPDEYNSLKYYKYLKELYEESKNTEQGNPNHKLTIGNHMDKTFNNLIASSYPTTYEICIATFYHDIGKIFTKEYNEKKGYYTYYGHHHFGAYLSLYLLNEICDKNSLIYIAFLIENHMFNLLIEKDSKAYNKFINIFGEKIYEDISIINLCDIMAKE